MLRKTECPVREAFGCVFLQIVAAWEWMCLSSPRQTQSETKSKELFDWVVRFLVPFTSKAIKLECFTASEYPAFYSEILKVYRQSVTNKDRSLELRLLEQVEHDLSVNNIKEG